MIGRGNISKVQKNKQKYLWAGAIYYSTLEARYLIFKNWVTLHQ